MSLPDGIDHSGRYHRRRAGARGLGRPTIVLGTVASPAGRLAAHTARYPQDLDTANRQEGEAAGSGLSNACDGWKAA
jgi:hypothetical protein